MRRNGDVASLFMAQARRPRRFFAGGGTSAMSLAVGFRLLVLGLAASVLVACEPAGPVAESLSGDALKARLTDQRITLTEAGSPRRATIDLRSGGKGTATLATAEPVFWEVRGAELCIGDAPDDLDCARTAISGDRITIRWRGERTGRPRQLSGVLSSL